MNTQYVEETLQKHEKQMFGDGTNLGDSHKVAIMWRLHVWILCIISAALGSGLTLGVQKLIH